MAVEIFRKTRFTIWRDRLLAITLLLLGLCLVNTAFQADGPDILCMILQLSASVVLLAAAGLSIFMLSQPILNVDKIGISEQGFLFKSLNWSMTWNDIACAQLTGELSNRVVLIGLHSNQPEHALSGYERFDAVLDRIRDGLKRYGRKVIDADAALRWPRSS